ncbi:hypothetical protein GQ43DRAFT_407703 [Delitschia confertaspora ATCC 74209]|uniref:N-acetylgalactosaminide beta-1,3-galactosyltransferase n=1 Tax=Delitschia confertaspora ATCC 74209 TaxID=1513339 RepID=A0A9P4JTK2_9PLEO|nr:hypothetical protein GQ43DRAFT_407703 [Delitschia confertaspora ATCC 74209]
MPQRTFLIRLLCCALFGATYLNIFGTSSPSFFSRYSKSPSLETIEEAFCPQSNLANDILVVLRTGATESHQKLPVHFKTTLRCVPHFLVLSDLDEEVEGHKIHDVLGGVSEPTRKEHPDFKLYHQLQSQGRAGLENQNVLTAQSGSSKGDYLNTENDGWKLDKWKFLPAIDKAFRYRPQAKWYVFIETDTYLVWNNVVEYLSNFDAGKDYYMGKHLYINNVEFAYGGAGFILSNPAMRKVLEHRSVHIKEYEDFTATHWVGDCALGKVLEDVKVPLFKAFPHLQGDSPATLNPNTTKLGRNLWCYPVVTYHHVSPKEIEELWAFEQEWFKRHPVLLRHRDIFLALIAPKLSPSKPAWDNMVSGASKSYNAKDHSHLYNLQERSSWRSFEHCRALCESKHDCIQFAFDEAGRKCELSESLRLGYERKGGRVRAGWVMERVEDLFGGLEGECGVRDWFVPEREREKEKEKSQGN